MKRIIKVMLCFALLCIQSVSLHAEEFEEQDSGIAEEIITEEEEYKEEENPSETVPEEEPDEENVEPQETPDPEEPIVTPEPEETPLPEETPIPEETPAPEETPVPEETPAPEDTPAPEETPVPEEESGETADEILSPTELENFLRGIYTVTLARDPAEAELIKWTAAVNEGTTAADIIKDIIFSEEFQSHFPSNASFVSMMYRAILGREGGASEITSWASRLDAGVSYGKVIQGFIGSAEFIKRCSVIGIRPGKFVSNLMADRYPDISAFVANIYLTVLQRGCDAHGLENWITKLTEGMSGTTLVSNFIESKEFRSNFPDHKTFVQIMYRTALGREGSEKEVASWAGRMDDGQTYKLILQGFLNSTEFNNKCRALGIKRGTYKSPYRVDQNRAVTRFVMDLYRIFLARDAEFGGLENWVGKLLDGETASKIITNILNSTEFQNRMPSNEDYIRMLYKAILERDGSETEVASWAEKMRNGQTYRAMMHGFIGSAEFRNKCESMGIKPGSYTSGWYVDKNYAVTCFASSFYLIGLGRNFKLNELEEKVKWLLTKQMSGAQYARHFLNSIEFDARGLSNEDFVSVLYECVLGRKRRDSTVGSSWVRNLENGMKRLTVLNGFVYSAEFKKRCDTLGILKENQVAETITQYTPVRYLQKDARWAETKINGYTLGKTGCVPTSIAMALSGILNKEILPPTVATWLYDNTQEFGRLAHGGSGAANKYAAQHWGVSCYGIDTANKLSAALAKGYIVTIIVGLGDFVITPGMTHEIVLWGSSAGSCNVYDPLGTSGKYSIESLFGQRSTDSYDLRGGYVCYAMYK